MAEKYYDAEKLAQALLPGVPDPEGDYLIPYQALRVALKKAEVEAVVPVRCGECKYYRRGDDTLGDCAKYARSIHCVSIDDYCSYGRRKDGEQK